jgi:hypothetical protein
MKGIPEASIRIGIARSQFQDRAILLNGAIQISLGLKRDPEVVHRLLKIGPKFNGLAISFDGAIEITLLSEQNAGIVVRTGIHDLRK